MADKEYRSLYGCLANCISDSIGKMLQSAWVKVGQGDIGKLLLWFSLCACDADVTRSSRPAPLDIAGARLPF